MGVCVCVGVGVGQERFERRGSYKDTEQGKSKSENLAAVNTRTRKLESSLSFSWISSKSRSNSFRSVSGKARLRRQTRVKAWREGGREKVGGRGQSTCKRL